MTKLTDQTNCGHDDKARFTSHLSLGSASTEGCDGLGTRLEYMLDVIWSVLGRATEKTHEQRA